jgi:predicted  nucleic acid-binding Zn-ribbon protein
VLDFPSVGNLIILKGDNLMADEAQTQPMLQTILERIDALATETRKRFDAVDERLEELDTRMDKTEGIVLDTRATVRELKSDLRKLREQLNLPVG